MKKTCDDIQQLLKQNNGRIKNVKIKNEFKDYVEESADAGMVCDIIDCCYHPSNECHKLKLDFEPYIDYNKAIAQHDWYDRSGNPTLTWFETNHYTKTGNTIWVDKGQNLNSLFEFLQEEKEYIFKTNTGNVIKIVALDNYDAKARLIDELIKLGYIELLNS
jgi:hypothetical protein